MKQRRKQRLAFVLLLVVSFGIGTALVLYSLEQNLLYFYTPSQVSDNKNPPNRSFNIGGLVVDGSVKHQGTQVHFEITDTAHIVQVSYIGILPDLFREGQGIVATGKINQAGVFVADRVLAKHDENYMPPEVAAALEAAKPIGIKSVQ